MDISYIMELADPGSGAMDETAFRAFLNEAYFGRKPVVKIQKAMDRICQKTLENPRWVCEGTPEAAALDKAVCDVFGFKRCSTYWRSSPIDMTGAFTIPQSRYVLSMDPKVTFEYGSNKNGFYDKNHVYEAVITMDQYYFLHGLTSEEVAAIYLHEIGHNFDLSVYHIVWSWLAVYDAVMKFVNQFFFNIDPKTGKVNPWYVNSKLKAGLELARDVGDQVISGIPNSDLRKMYADMTYNIDDIILNLIPPAKEIERLAGPLFPLVMAIVNTVSIVQLGIDGTLLTLLMVTPLLQVSNIYQRKAETYADSFAAAYGYGPEVASGLEKMFDSMIGRGFGDDNPLLAPFYDLSVLSQEVLSDLMNEHGSVQGRYKRMLDALDHDLEKSGLSREDKASIKRERDRLDRSYRKFLDKSPEERHYIVTLYRRMMENWHQGRNYLLSPITGRDQTYAD